MKLFLASALQDDVRWAADNGLLDAVVTSPALLTAARAHDDRDHLLELCRLASGPVFASVRSTHGLDAYRDARELARLSDQIVVTLPLVEDVLPVVRRLARDGIPVAATLVFTAAQALLAARAGVSRLFLSVGQLELNGLDGVAAVREARQVLDAASEECDLVALFPASASQFAACAAAGADAAAVTCDVLRTLLVHPLTARGIAQFEQDLAARPRLWSAS
jgi:transaldolase